MSTIPSSTGSGNQKMSPCPSGDISSVPTHPSLITLLHTIEGVSDSLPPGSRLTSMNYWGIRDIIDSLIPTIPPSTWQHVTAENLHLLCIALDIAAPGPTPPLSRILRYRTILIHTDNTLNFFRERIVHRKVDTALPLSYEDDDLAFYLDPDIRRLGPDIDGPFSFEHLQALCYFYGVPWKGVGIDVLRKRLRDLFYVVSATAEDDAGFDPLLTANGRLRSFASSVESLLTEIEEVYDNAGWRDPFGDNKNNLLNVDAGEEASVWSGGDICFEEAFSSSNSDSPPVDELQREFQVYLVDSWEELEDLMTGVDEEWTFECESPSATTPAADDTVLFVGEAPLQGNTTTLCGTSLSSTFIHQVLMGLSHSGGVAFKFNNPAAITPTHYCRVHFFRQFGFLVLPSEAPNWHVFLRPPPAPNWRVHFKPPPAPNWMGLYGAVIIHFGGTSMLGGLYYWFGGIHFSWWGIHFRLVKKREGADYLVHLFRMGSLDSYWVLSSLEPSCRRSVLGYQFG